MSLNLLNRNISRKLLLFLITCFIFLLCQTNPVFSSFPASTLTAGVSKVNITPEKPVPICGYEERQENFEGIHDQLYSRFIVLGDGQTKAAVISVEIYEIPFSFRDKVKTRVEEETGIPASNILLCSANTHSGPSLNSSYLEQLENKIVDGMKKASENICPARIGAGKGICKMSINRRARSAKGGLAMGRNPYKPVDWEVGVIRIDDLQGRPLAIITNWGCHANALGADNKLITGDWPGYASNMLEDRFGENCIAPVLIGASGDVNPFFQGYTFNEGIVRERDIITGHTLAEEVIKVAGDIKTYPDAPVSVKQKMIRLPGKEETSEEEYREEGLKAFTKKADIQLNLTALKVGTVILAGISGQMFNEIGTRFKELSPYKYSFTIDHCNGSAGYIPTDKAYREGGYEILKSRLMPGNENVIIDNLIEMTNKL